MQNAFEMATFIWTLVRIQFFKIISGLITYHMLLLDEFSWFCLSSGDSKNDRASWETITWSSFGWHLGWFHLSFQECFVLFSWLIFRILQYFNLQGLSFSFLFLTTCSALVQFWCSYMTVPLNVIVSQVGLTLIFCISVTTENLFDPILIWWLTADGFSM